MFTISKKFNDICVAHRNWKSKTHCSFIHGYARSVELVVGCHQLAEEDWVYDFSKFKEIRKFLEENWDHRLLIADDDPQLEELKRMHELKLLNLNIMDTNKGYGPSIEQSCKFVADFADNYIKKETNNRCFLVEVNIWEKQDNKATLKLV